MPSLTPTHDLPELVEGDDVPFPVTFARPAGNPIDITDWTVSVTVKSHNSETPVIQKDITDHGSTTGETSFEFNSDETAGLGGDTYRYDIQATKPGGEVRTIVIGRVPFVDGVTDRTPGAGGSGGDAAGGGIDIAVALGTDSIAVDVAIGGTFSASDVPAAIDGATITPAQVGTASDPVNSTYTDELLVSQQFTGPTVQTVSDLPMNVPAGTKFFVTAEGRYYTQDGQQ